MFISILGRQPKISIAELESIYGSKNVSWFSESVALIDTPDFDFNRLGGSQKAGLIVKEFNGNPAFTQVSKQIIGAYSTAWANHSGKITLGISAYGFDKLSGREVQKTGIILKSKLKKSGVSLRLIPSSDPFLNTATSHHNKLGLKDNKVELLIVQNQAGRVLVAESVGAQNITALASRDQGRPARDAFVGMLPPKLAQQIINLAIADKNPRDVTLLDPFCGTGVILQEASLMGAKVYGTDLNQKMIDYSQKNLQWLQNKIDHQINPKLETADAQDHLWRQPIDVVAAEGYLGQPFSAPPTDAKLKEVVGNCNHIIGNFLKNLHPQIQNDTRICLAVPAWADRQGDFTHLPLVSKLKKYGFERVAFKNLRDSDLLYYRPEQVVARELLVLQKI